jgi:hypothetical protein
VSQSSILFVHVYLKNDWKTISRNLIRKIPQDRWVLHLAFDLIHVLEVPRAVNFFKKVEKPPDRIFFSEKRKGLGKVHGFRKFLKKVDLSPYKALTYVHAKGVTKPADPHVQDWVELMRYFHMERRDLMWKAFREGYALYGVNLFREGEAPENKGKYAFRYAPYIFRGNFVSANLTMLREKMKDTPVDEDYYGVEGYWGKLCPVDQAFCVHESGLSHYTHPYPATRYKTA